MEKFLSGADILHSVDKFAFHTKKTKSIVTIHDMLWYAHCENRMSARLLAKQAIESLKGSCAIITSSEFSKSEIIRYLPFAKGKIRVISGGVSGRFRPIEKGRIPKEIHRKYPWDDCLLYLGTLNDPRKNVGLVVRAFAALKKAGRINERLILCGDIGRYSRDLLRLIKEINLPDDIAIYPRWLPD